MPRSRLVGTLASLCTWHKVSTKERNEEREEKGREREGKKEEGGKEGEREER